MRRGLSLVEVLVVIAVLAALVSLLLPAALRVREAAGVARDLNNLKQLSLAACSHAEANGGDLPNHLFIKALPYLEEAALYRRIVDVDPPVLFDPPSAVPVRAFLSPLDPTTGGPHVTFVQGNVATHTSYAVNAQVVNRPGTRPLAALADDGLSNTVLFAGHYAKRCGGVSLAFTSVCCTYAPGGEDRQASFADAGPSVVGSQTGDVYPVTAGNGSGPSVGGVTFQVAPRPEDCDHRVANAASRRGLSVAMADGSARTLAPSIKPETYWGLVTPDAGDLLGSDW